MKIKKAENQYYSKYFELKITSIILKCQVEDLENFKQIKDFNFSQEEINEMDSDAALLVDTYFKSSKTAVHTGTNTSLSNSDIIIDGEQIEIKYVESGSGTYYNTTINYLQKLNFINFNEFYKNKGYYQFLESLDLKPNILNTSPFTQAEGINIMKSKDLYKKIQEKDKVIRAMYVDELFKFLLQNDEARNKMAYDMISKNESNKDIVDKIIVYNYDTKNLTCVTKDDLISKISSNIKKSGKYSIIFGNYKVTIAWQNGTGLNNPTIRVFI
jgi:hypothetical protein